MNKFGLKCNAMMRGSEVKEVLCPCCGSTDINQGNWCVDENCSEHHGHVRAEVYQRWRSTLPVTWEEYGKMRLNSWEQELMYQKMDHEALINITQLCVKNCTPPRNRYRPASTYDEAVVWVLVPLLIKMLQLFYREMGAAIEQCQILSANKSAKVSNDLMRRLKSALMEGAQLDLPHFLNWTADRLVQIHKENPNVDYVLTLRDRAKKCQEAIDMLKAIDTPLLAPLKSVAECKLDIKEPVPAIVSTPFTCSKGQDCPRIGRQYGRDEFG